MIKSISTLIELAKQKPSKTLVVACAEDDYVLKAVSMATTTLNMRAILVGDEHQIKSILAINPMDDVTIINATSKSEACHIACDLIHQGAGHILMKGLVDTSILLKAVLDKTHALIKLNRLSHVSLIEVANYHKLFMISDAAMNMYPDATIKKDIILNGLDVLHRLGYNSPNVGVIAAIEKENPKMPATVDAIELKDMHAKGLIPGCQIDGPFALDNAINKEAAIHKGVTSKMAGEVDFLLMPQIETGNVFYKSLMFLSNAKSASIVVGATCPIVLTSRADKIETKYASIALAKLY